MAASKFADRLCALAVVAALLICVVCMNGAALGITVQAGTMGYENRIFDTDRVHTIDIIMDNWEEFLSTAQSEEYSVCTVVIDGEAFRNVGIRGKGNTSLSTVASMDSDRYSFKIEFDQYDSANSYYGLDKLSLNNLIQDNTMMKDYLTYRMMNEFGAPSPLCSYTYLTVNGEDWGLYLAVEAVEDSFLRRNYGNDYGELYKPDSMNMGGGRGNGKDFNMDDFMGADGESGSAYAEMPGGRGHGGMGMGTEVTKLQYIDDEPGTYSTIFDSAKTDITTADQNRLIASLKSLTEGTDLEQVVNVEDVLRYFVVHNYVVNGDSYTGSMIHNYYLYEEDDRLSMIPWDYNLAFGTFMGGSAASSVNDDIDSPLSVTGSDRPMIDWLLNNEEYNELYHQYFREFLNTVDVQAIIAHAYTLIAPYVERDPTKFCTDEEFEQGVETLAVFCDLRSQSVAAQLAGEEANIDASAINVSDMGTMGGGGRDQMQQMPEGMEPHDGMQMPEGMEPPDGMQMPEGMEFHGGMQMPEGMEPPDGMQMPGGMEMPNGMTAPGGAETPQDETTRPDGTVPAQNGQTRFPQTNFPAENWSDSNMPQSSNQWLLLGLSALILAAGLLFAFKFKR